MATPTKYNADGSTKFAPKKAHKNEQPLRVIANVKFAARDKGNHIVISTNAAGYEVFNCETKESFCGDFDQSIAYIATLPSYK